MSGNPLNSMERIDSIDRYNHIIEGFFRKGTQTNNYLLEDRIRALIGRDKLFFLIQGLNAFILDDRVGYFQLYYYLNDPSALYVAPFRKTTVMEILYRGLDRKPEQAVDFWKKSGFTEHLTRILLNANISQTVAQETGGSAEIRFAQDDADVRFANELLDAELDYYTGDRLSFDELKLFATGRNLLLAVQGGERAGVLQFEIRNHTAWLGHIAVNPVFRGQGLAGFLVAEYINLNVAKTNRFALWVIHDNTPAVNLYNKFGFSVAHKTTVSFILG
jgi:ribosomal protein S18 acetylase RimI-like enzyme